MKDLWHYFEEDKAATNEICDDVLPKTIVIDSPKAFPGDKVFFNNPRNQRLEMEVGTVSGVSVHWIDADNYIIHPRLQA